jgi:hypothetical protein
MLNLKTHDALGRLRALAIDHEHRNLIAGGGT